MKALAGVLVHEKVTELYLGGNQLDDVAMKLLVDGLLAVGLGRDCSKYP